MTKTKDSGGEPSGIVSRGGFLAGFVLLALLMNTSVWAQEKAAGPPTEKPQGSGVNASGGPAIDPSKNVLDVVQAMKEMLRELRSADKELSDAKLRSERDLNELRSKYDKELLSAATNQLNSEAKLRADFNERYALTEKGRVDAIRLVDKNAVDVATAGSVATASALAKTVQDTAENSRKLVETTALETNRNIQQQFAAVTALLLPIGTRLTALEQAGAEGLGRQKFQDPNTERLTRLVEGMASRQATTTGVDTGRGDVIGWVIGGASFLIMMLIGIGALIVNMMKSSPRRQ